MPNSKELTIIIVNYASKEFLRNCLASLRQNGPSEAEIIVVNNDPQENLDELLVIFPTIKIVENAGNGGFGQANNLAAQKAQGKNLLFLNPDTEIRRAGLVEALTMLTADADLGVIGARLLAENGETQAWCAGVEASLSDLIKNNLGWSRSRQIWEKREKTSVDWVSGAAMLVKKEVFMAVGGFDEQFFMYFEDMDLCRRVRTYGKKVLFLPQWEVIHYGGKSQRDKQKQKKYFYTSQDRYFLKNQGRWQATAVRILRNIFA